MNIEITRGIIDWNSARFPREYNRELAQELCAEEAAEYLEAIDKTHKACELADMYFVAVGQLWKLGLDEYQIANMPYVNEIHDSNQADKTFLVDILWWVNVSFKRMGISNGDKAEVIQAIITANNTKPVKKTVPGQKYAEGIDPKAGYTPPSVTVDKILARRAKCG